MPKIGKLEKARRDEGAIRGVMEELPDDEPIMIDKKTYTKRELVALFEEHLKALARVRELTIERNVAVDRERSLEPEVKRVAYHLGKLFKSRVGPHNPKLRKYAVEPDKKPRVPVVVKAQAVARRLETRKLRRTMGRRQRAKIKAGA